MENQLEAIRAAVTSDATPEARAAAAAACRELLAALEPVLAPPTPASTPQPTDAATLAQLTTTAVGMLRNVPVDQLLELAITTLRAKLPANTQLAPSRPISFQFLPVPSKKS